jgi:hydrogenase expression/formation protein HypC
MCLAIPGKVVEVSALDAEKPLRMGRVDFGGVIKDVCLAYVPEADAGDYVIVHVGFAIARLDETEAQRSLALWAELQGGERERGAS